MRELLTSVVSGMIAGGFGFLAAQSRGFVVVAYGSIAICALLVALRQAMITNSIARANAWFSRSVTEHGKRPGDVAKYGIRPLAFADRQVARFSDRIRDTHVRAGVQLATAMLAVEVVIFLFFMAVFVAIGVAITIFGLWAAFTLLSSASASQGDVGEVDDSDSNLEPSHPYAKAGRSRSRQTWFGDPYEEIVNENGDVISTVHRKSSFSKGDHLEYRNAAGEVIADGQARERMFGDRVVELRSPDGTLLGESQRKEGWFGDKYVEHRDADSKPVSESRDVTPILGDQYRDIREV